MKWIAGTKVEIGALAGSIVRAFPKLNLSEGRLSLELYRLLAEGLPVPREMLAERLDLTAATVSEILDSWPGVFSDSQQRVVGYWGLSIPSSYAGPHKLRIDGRTLSAWCAWDTLFLPQLLGNTVTVESTSPVAGAGVRLTVTPNGVERAQPADAHISFLLPDAARVEKDIVTTFCHFVHFFPSRRAAEDWSAEHPGTFVLSIDEGYELARRKNEAQYGELL